MLIAFSNESHDSTLELIRSLKDLDVQIDIVPRLFDIVGTEIGIHTVEGLPLLGLRPLRLSASSQLLKRGMDVCLAGLGLLLLAPTFALIALAIKLESPGPGVFPARADGHRREDVPDPEVQDDDRGRRGEKG